MWGTSSWLLQKAQLLLLTLDEGYLLIASPPDLQGGVAHLSPPGPAQPLSLNMWLLLYIPTLLNLSPISLPILSL